MLHQQQKQKEQKVTHISIQLLATIVCIVNKANAVVFFPRGGSFGYLAAVAMPLDLPNRNVYMAFNFEANYGLPSNDSYNEWIDRWNIDEELVGIENDITAINGRRHRLLSDEESKRKRRKRSLLPRYDRRSFYRTFTGYLEYFQMNGTACLLRTICEVAASSLHENNGVLGSIFKILFMPTTSEPETTATTTHHNDIADADLYRAEWQGRNYMGSNKNNLHQNEGDVLTNACMDYTHWCPEGVINMISTLY